MGDEELCPAGGKENLRNHSLYELPRKSTENGQATTCSNPPGMIIWLVKFFDNP